MRLKELYQKEILPKLKEKFGYKNSLEAPKMAKLVINVGFGRHNKDKAYIDNVVKTLTNISGQKPILTKAKKAISSFKIREGMIIGASVTLRGQRMYDFVERLVNVSFPRVRDFRGISEKCVDKAGNITIGIKENVAFPEIKVEEIENIHGLEISISTNKQDRESSLELFRLIGFPFKQEDNKK